MSHFTSVRTRLVDPKFILAACADLGFAASQGTVEIRGYQGNRMAVEIAMPTRDSGYDIDFRRDGETYEMVADWWGIRDINPEEMLRQLAQRYAYHATIAGLTKQGFDVVSDTRENDGRLHLVLRRVACPGRPTSPSRHRRVTMGDRLVSRTPRAPEPGPAHPASAIGPPVR